uniref:Soluble calcium-activated nucleotidase 1 n=1 Tax=Panagrolaimus sp. JU765 TaxID=591449 RepID=A0AC34RKR9_9BILA
MSEDEGITETFDIEMVSKEKSSAPSLSAFNYTITGGLALIVAISFAALIHYLPLATTCYSKPYNSTDLATIQTLSNGDKVYHIAVVTDLDNDSKDSKKKNTWFSYFKIGELTLTKDLKKATIVWEDEKTKVLTSQIAAGGRSMELSDLKVFDGHLLTVDDRTGIIYRLENNFKDAVPWVLLNDGPGNITKGLKAEWMTVKNNVLVVGGLGKEWTTTDGVFQNYHPMYVKYVNHLGEVEHINWVDNYKKLRRSIGIEWPGYMIHESGQWSEIHNKWFFMPRRASKEGYTEATDEFAGTDLLLIANEDFSHVQVKHVGDRGNGAKGYSAFQFIPGSHDDLIVALKSEEKEGIPVA